MPKYSFLTILTFLSWVGCAEAQVFTKSQAPAQPAVKNQVAVQASSPAAEVSATESSTDETTVEEQAQPLPYEPDLTAEERISAQRGLMLSINKTAASIEANEANRLVDTISTLEEIQVRRRNRKAESGQKIDYKPQKVNVENKAEFGQYLKDKFVKPIDASLELSKQEATEKTENAEKK